MCAEYHDKYLTYAISNFTQMVSDSHLVCLIYCPQVNSWDLPSPPEDEFVPHYLSQSPLHFHTVCVLDLGIQEVL